MSYEAARAEKVKNNPFRIGVGVGSYGGNGGGGVGVSSSGVKNVSEGTLVIHAIDPARKAEVWQGPRVAGAGQGQRRARGHPEYGRRRAAGIAGAQQPAVTDFSRRAVRSSIAPVSVSSPDEM